MPSKFPTCIPNLALKGKKRTLLSKEKKNCKSTITKWVMHKTAKITFTTFLGFKSKVKIEFIARLERFECLLTLQLSKGLQTKYAICTRQTFKGQLKSE